MKAWRTIFKDQSKNNTKWDYIIPIGLSTIIIIISFLSFLIFWGMGNGNIELVHIAFIIIAITYLVMIVFTRFTRPISRILVFPLTGLISVFIYLLIGGIYINYIHSRRGEEIVNFAVMIGTIAFLGVGYLLGNIVLALSRRYRK